MVKLTSILNWNGYHNIPKKYIYRKMFKGVVYENVHGITPPVVYNYTKDWIYDENAPWTTAAQFKNDPSKPRKQILVPPLLEWTYFRGDKVQIMKGKDEGKIVGFNASENVSNITFLQKELPLVVNKEVKLLDPSDGKPCDASFRYDEKGELKRVSKRTGVVMPLPPAAESTIDYKSKASYQAGASDTKDEEVLKKTFQPKYKTFEQDLMDEYGIEKPKNNSNTFVY